MITHLSAPFILGSGPVPCEDAADANDSGQLDVADAVFLLTVLFVATADSIPPPTPDFGIDLTPDPLGCDSFGGCPDPP
ncbi:MAG: hypothetical protein ACE5GW_10800 [Planctomycetota bacterium]